MSIAEAARILGVSRKLIYRLIRDGDLTAIRLPPPYIKGEVKIPREQVDRILLKQRQAPTA